MINPMAVKIVQQWLDANEVGLWAHDFSDSGCCYAESLSADRSDVVGSWITPEQAFDLGFLWLDDSGIRGLGGGDLLPMVWDFVKIRRRCEDHLRKTTKRTLLKIATELGVNLV